MRTTSLYVFNATFEQISHGSPVYLWLTLNIFLSADFYDILGKERFDKCHSPSISMTLCI